MNKILVFDLPAHDDGALEIISDFYRYAYGKEEYEFCFILSDELIKELDNISIQVFKWYRYSVIHRLIFDVFMYSRLIRKVKPDIIISFENKYINSHGNKEIVYVQQGLFFCDDFFRGRTMRMRLQQGIYGRFVKCGLRKAHKIVVQTHWMKDEILARNIINENDIKIVYPRIEKPFFYYKDSQANRKSFFYPAPLKQYKNHDVIVNAAQILVEQGVEDFQIQLTLTEEEFCKAYPNCKRDNFICTGHIAHEIVMKAYTNSTLLFPSIVESFGLPLLEAAMVKTFILAADTSASNEVLQGYANADFFGMNDAERLADLMRDIIENNRIYHEDACISNNGDVDWDLVISSLE